MGTDRRGKKFEDYTFEEFARWEEHRDLLLQERWKSDEFRGHALDKETPVTEEEIREEKLRRVKIAEMEGGKKPGRYSGNPAWDDVIPIPQDDGERPLAAIAYTDEYSEGKFPPFHITRFYSLLPAISYLRAVMAADEHSPRILDLTAHIIRLNPAHYTVWLYRASTLFALESPLRVELEWVNEIALANQKNYQIWHHRQLLIEAIFPTLTTPAALQELARSEVDFITIMFEEDSKNYHVWSYRQYLVRKLSLFPSQTASTPLLSELTSLDTLIRNDVRNNSAWSHRFFVVFSDPGISTPGTKATEPDPAIPADILDREIEVAKSAIWRAPQNQSPWNYFRGVLRKGGRDLGTAECFASEFVKFGDAADGGEETEEVRSSHALDLLADIWAAKGETKKADKALRLLGEKYDPIRQNYWEWKRGDL